MAYKNTNKNKDRWPWMGQRFREQRRERKSFLTKKEAQAWEKEEIKEVAPTIQTDTTSLGDWANKYLDYSKEKHTYRTFNAKQFAFLNFFTHPGIDKDVACESMTMHSAQQALQAQVTNRTGNSANSDLKHLKAAWNWGTKYLDLPEKNPFRQIEKFASIRHERKVPSLADFWAVYHEAKDEQDKLMLYCFLQTGARKKELFNLTWEDVDFFGKRVRLKSRKNVAAEWHSAWISVKDELIKWLMRWMKESKRSGKDTVFFFDQHGQFKFSARDGLLPSLCKKAGVEYFSWHGIRHLFASILASENVPLVEIQRMCRHSSILTTEKYIHWLQTENRAALEALPNLEKVQQTVQQQAK